MVSHLKTAGTPWSQQGSSRAEFGRRVLYTTLFPVDSQCLDQTVSGQWLATSAPKSLSNLLEMFVRNK